MAPGDYDAGLGQADMTLSRVRYRQALDQAEDLPQMTPGYPDGSVSRAWARAWPR